MGSLAGYVLTLADDLLGENLILLPTLTDMSQAYASYAAFRRVIIGHTFLYRLHALHPPSLLGFYTTSGRFQPAESPHPAAPAIAGAADFSFSFPLVGCVDGPRHRRRPVPPRLEEPSLHHCSDMRPLIPALCAPSSTASRFVRRHSLAPPDVA
jgi:hypothetical protein